MCGHALKEQTGKEFVTLIKFLQPSLSQSSQRLLSRPIARLMSRVEPQQGSGERRRGEAAAPTDAPTPPPTTEAPPTIPPAKKRRQEAAAATRPLCKEAKADLVFLVDGSWSIGDDNFLKITRFLYSTMGSLDVIGPDGTQINIGSKASAQHSVCTERGDQGLCQPQHAISSHAAAGI
ncbi:hypothetical protein CRUP_010796 [Coryphaenoides rupestris]|nr:hypothetical protein CRUP_010796 [Coryphaenoides rupestris]